MSKKGKIKKSVQNVFITIYVIKSFKTSNFYYQKVLVKLNVSWRYESSKFSIFTSKIRVKSETLAMKNAIPTAKNRIFLDTCFWIGAEHLRYICMQLFLGVILWEKK